MANSREVCILCKDEEGNDPLVTVGQKGRDTLVDYAKRRNNESLETELKESQKLTVHPACRRDFTNPRRKSDTKIESPQKKRLRSSVRFIFFIVVLTTELAI